MLVRIETAEFAGKTTLRCRCCGTKSIYPGGITVVIYDFDRRRLVVIDAGTGARLHDCRILRVWQCPDCGEGFELRTRRDRVGRFRCPRCMDVDLIQVEMPADGPVVPIS